MDDKRVVITIGLEQSELPTYEKGIVLSRHQVSVDVDARLSTFNTLDLLNKLVELIQSYTGMAE